MREKLFQMELDRIKKRGERQKRRQALKNKYAEYYPNRGNKKVSNIVLAVIVMAVIGYTVASFMLQYHTSTEISPTLTTLWFSFWTVEACALAGIKISKVKKHSEETSEDDDILG